MLARVPEVEAVVEVGRIATLRVLQDRLELVQRLCQPRLRRLRRLVLIPQRENLISAE